MEEVNKRIEELFELLLKRTSMIVPNGTSYALVSNYIVGVLDGLSLQLNFNLHFKIMEWYFGKVGVKTNCFWITHLQISHEGKSENELNQVLIELVQQYFLENPLTISEAGK